MTVLAVVVLAAVVLAAVLLRPGAPEPVATQPGAPESAPLVVGDGRTVTLLSLGGPTTDAVLSRVADQIGPATDQVERFWGTDWSKDIIVVATDSAAQFNAAAPGAAAEMAAVAMADAVDVERGTADGQRIVLGPEAHRMSDEALRLVVTHELFHYAARAHTAAEAPRWLTEGVADYLARPAPQTSPLPPPTALPTDDEFSSPEPGLSQAYDRAWLFARFVADRYGVAALRQLYRSAAGRDRLHPAAALSEITGADPDQLLLQWRHWLTEPR